MGVVRPNRADMRGGLPRKDRARALRGNMTHPERALWKELRDYKLGWRFRRQFPIPPYIVDFACIEARLIIEVDGGQQAAPATTTCATANSSGKGGVCCGSGTMKFFRTLRAC